MPETPLMLDVLIIAPHPDDAEIGMGGSVVKLQREGMSVGVLDLTSGEPTPFGTPELRQQETEAASRVLDNAWRRNLGLTNRELRTDLKPRAAIAEAIRETRPRWLFAPFWVDAHPDHTAGTQLAEDARFWAKLTKSTLAGQPHHPARLFHYFALHLRQAIVPDWIVDISDSWDQKLAALKCYESQFVRGREGEKPTILERIEVHAAYFGHLIGCAYGEPFACREVLGVRHWTGVL